MAVKVINSTAIGVGGNKTEITTPHSDGAAIQISDGHLIVVAEGSNTKPLAIYAPGAWVSAVVTK